MSRGNGDALAKIENKREAHRPMLSQVNQTVAHEVQGGYRGATEQPEMDGVRKLIDKGTLKVADFEGDSENDLLNMKPMRICATMDALGSAVDGICRTGCPRHEQLKGQSRNGSKSAQAASGRASWTRSWTRPSSTRP